MDEEIIMKYKKAGKIASQVLRRIRDYVTPKKKIDLFDIAVRSEKWILELGGKVAFPCNVGLNEVAAHYTPLEHEEVEFREGALKIDVGVHIDGYIADTALTVARGYEFESMARVNEYALSTVLDEIRVGASLGELGGIIEDVITQNGYKVITDLMGHLIDRYNLHAGKNFPNHREWLSDKVRVNEVYAVEPFVTFRYGSGHVRSSDAITIYSLSKTKKIKDKKLDKVRKKIMTRFGPLPFTPRWLDDDHEVYTQLMNMGVLRGYPVLIEARNAPVSQFEHTVLVTESGIIVTTK